MSKIVECVPNFSEGRDLSKIEAIKSVIKAVSGAFLLDVDPGAATNRTVVTIVGEPEAVAEAAFLAVKKASESIDMRGHTGAHPRMGATDVCPFIPVAGMTMEETVALSRKLAERIGKELKIPVYLYEYSASCEERRSLANIREGEYEGMGEKMKDPKWKPDFGPAEFNPVTGATAVGAREFLIAYNLNLNSKNVKLADKIAKEIREKGTKDKPGLLKAVRAVGWYIDEYERAQISVNLINYKVTPLWKLFDTACSVAEKYGIRITGSELVGLIPLGALKEAGEYYLKKQGEFTAMPEREVLKIAVKSLGLGELYPFDLNEKVIEYKISKKGILTSMSLAAFADELSSSSPAPGGGSVAALAGSLAAALVSMVASLTFGKKGYEEHFSSVEELAIKAQALKADLMKIVDTDTELFNEFMAARRLPKGSEEEKKARDAKILSCAVNITRSPLELLRKLQEVLPLTEKIAGIGNANSISDAAVAASMLKAAAEGALLNVLINLPSLEDAAMKDSFKKESEAACAEIQKGCDGVFSAVSGKLKREAK